MFNFILFSLSFKTASSGCYAITQVCYAGCYASLFYINKSVVSVIQKHVTTLHIKLFDKTRNKVSGCGAAGSALPWGNYDRKVNS